MIKRFSGGESTPVLEIGTNTLHGVAGMMIDDGMVEILEEPVWRDYDGRMCWVALARVGNALCLIEVEVTKHER